MLEAASEIAELAGFTATSEALSVLEVASEIVELVVSSCNSAGEIGRLPESMIGHAGSDGKRQLPAGNSEMDWLLSAEP